MITLRQLLVVVMTPLLFGTVGCMQAIAGATTLSLPESAGEPVVVHQSLPNWDKPTDWSAYFAVYVDETESSLTVSSVQGTYYAEKEKLTFRPYFPFVPGLSYRVDVASEFAEGLQGIPVHRSGGEFVGIPFSIPVSTTLEQPSVERIYPTACELPENVLRFYIYFSNPMQRGWASRTITLQTIDGSDIENVLMEFKQELWDPDQKRLTVLFDPGRIKRGVRTNVQLGQALHAGRQYKLVIDTDWPDVHGQALGNRVEKEFLVTPAVRSAVQITNWTLKLPRVGSKGPLKLTFDRPLDHALLGRLLSVRDTDGRRVIGHVDLGQNELSWHFHPLQPWKSGSYEVTIQPELEDLAGNNLFSPLDHKLGQKTEKGQNLMLPFFVKQQLDAARRRNTYIEEAKHLQ